AAAMASYAIVNACLVALAISLSERRSFLSVLVPPLKVNALHYAANTAVGLEAAVLWLVDPKGLFLLALPVCLAFVLYRTLMNRLKEGDRFRNLVVENASDGIVVSAADGKVLSWNPAMERLTGRSAEDAVGVP